MKAKLIRWVHWDCNLYNENAGHEILRPKRSLSRAVCGKKHSQDRRLYSTLCTILKSTDHRGSFYKEPSFPFSSNTRATTSGTCSSFSSSRLYDQRHYHRRDNTYLARTRLSPVGRPEFPSNPGTFTTGTCNAVHRPQKRVSALNSSFLGASPAQLGVMIAE
jgi:hypothetical protein